MKVVAAVLVAAVKVVRRLLLVAVALAVSIARTTNKADTVIRVMIMDTVVMTIMPKDQVMVVEQMVK